MNAVKSIVVGVLCLAAGMVGAAPLYQCPLTVGGYAEGNAALADFPVLVRISTAIDQFNYGDCAAGGADISFTSEDGKTVYPHEVDTWNPNGESLVWVKLPSMAHGTKFLFRWADQNPPVNDTTAVWTNYVSVWHLDDDSAVQADSSSKAINATLSGTGTYTLGAGKVGLGMNKSSSLSTAADYMTLSGMGNGASTVSGWFYWPKHTASQQYAHPFMLGSWGAGGWYAEFNSSVSVLKFINNNAITTINNTGITTSEDWVHLTVTYTGSKVNVYFNGNIKSSASGTIKAATSALVISDFQGWVDETRVRIGAVSDEWVKAEYEVVTKADYLAAGTTEILSTTVIVVSSDGPRYGVVSPAYGQIAELEAGTTYDFSCTTATQAVNTAGTTRAVCTGWELRRLSDGGLIKASSSEGESPFSCSHQYVQGEGVELKWLWQVQHQVTATAEEGGTVSPTSVWVNDGERVTLSATATDAGSAFSHWEGAVNSPANPLVVEVTQPMELTALFGSKVYVSKAIGSDEFAGTRDEPYATIEKALEGKPAKVIVGGGEYTVTNPALTVNWPCEIVSEDGAAKTTLKATSYRQLALGHAGARLIGFKLTSNGTGTQRWDTGVVAHGSAGLIADCVLTCSSSIFKSPFAFFNGTLVVSNCVFRNSTLTGNANGDRSHEVHLEGNAVMTHCVVSNLTFGGTMNYGGCRAFVSLAGSAVLRNTLFADNRFNAQLTYNPNGIVYAAENVTVENCTFVGNLAPVNNGAVLAIDSGETAKAVYRNLIFDNNLIYGSTSSRDILDKKYSAAPWTRVVHSCSAQLTEGEGNIVTAPKLGTEANPFEPQVDSACVDGGATADWMTGATDLAGNPRVRGDAPDMGCYEAAARPAGYLGVALSLSAKQGEAPFEPSVLALVSGDKTGLAYAWDFGDGFTSTEEAPSHAYTDGGRYMLRLTVRNAAGVEASDEVTVVVVPDTIYVAKNSSGLPPYESEGNAAPSISAAFAMHAKRIVVGDGTYEITTDGDALDWPCTIISKNGPTKTTLNGSGKRVMKLTHDEARLSGFTITGGAYINTSDNENAITVIATKGLIDNCVFASDGNNTFKTPYMRIGGTAVLSNCVIRAAKLRGNLNYEYSHTTYVYGSAVMTHCVVSNCSFNQSADYGGCRGFVTLDGSATLRNTLFDNNRFNSKFNNTVNGIVTVQGGATVESCTFVNNRASTVNGGVLAVNTTGSPVLRNLVFDGNLIYDSETLSDIRDHQNLAAPWTRVSHSCSSQLTGGTGNFNTTPKLGVEGFPYMPGEGSVCIDHGEYSPWMDGATDLVGNDRIRGDVPDMGCYEAEPPDPRQISVTIVVPSSQGLVPFEASFDAVIVGNDSGIVYAWDFGDGTTSDEAAPSHTYENPGIYTATLEVTNDAGGSASHQVTVTAVPETIYVSKNGKGIPPYASWEDAATTFHDAYLMKTRTIMIDDGTYDITTENDPLDWECTVISRNGPKKTTLNGVGKRIMLLSHAKARLSGFRLTGGAYINTGSDGDNAITVKATKGLVDNCIFASNGNNTYKTPYMNVSGSAVISNCTIATGVLVGNLNNDKSHSMYFDGNAVMTHCVVTNCSLDTGTSSYGGCKAIVDLRGNAQLRNTLFVNTKFKANLTDNGKGIVRLADTARADNCTFVGCETPKTSGGILAICSTAAAAHNLVFSGNTILANANVKEVFDLNAFAEPWTRVTYSCSVDLTDGVGNTAADPVLRPSGSKRPYQFGQRSPCYDRGLRLDWMEGATDLLGNPRIFNAAPDMGCYESRSGGMAIFVR